MTLADTKEEEMAKQRHGRYHAQVCLAVVGEDGQEEDRVGMEMQRLQPVMGKDLIEEVGEGGTCPAMMLLMKKGKKVLSSGSGTTEPARSSVFPLSLLSPAVSRRVATRLFSKTLGASRAGSY